MREEAQSKIEEYARAASLFVLPGSALPASRRPVTIAIGWYDIVLQFVLLSLLDKYFGRVKVWASAASLHFLALVSSMIVQVRGWYDSICHPSLFY